jgi:EAL domain-containing protein (putative c-di-GMP-specific phosphodiesterase class I)
VNVSAHQLLATGFVTRLESLLQQYGLPSRALELELTENVLQTGAATIAVLRKLREIGISLAIDDFGIGYSSLTSLERLPLTRVKIDGSLIASIDGGTRSPAIVRSIIGLSHSLGLQVTAEGVERASQLRQLLNDRGVHVQGFLVSRPLVPAAVPIFIAGCQRQLSDLLESLPPPVDLDNTGSVRALRTAQRKS